MAKIDNGPLVSNISGSIGELTFQRGLSGQIVRSKPWPPYPGSPAQQASIDRFRKAMNTWRDFGPWTKLIYLDMAHRLNRNAWNIWMQHYIAWSKTGIWPQSPIHTENPPCFLTASYIAGGKLWSTFSSRILPWDQALGMALKDGDFASPIWSGSAETSISTFPGDWFNTPPPPPFWLIAWPYWITPPSTAHFGRPTTIYVA